ncbi:MAG: tRNA(Ile)(2)-agmatinylcytidine synthase, partial [Candidatus Ranarchaeia archaeon]
MPSEVLMGEDTDLHIGVDDTDNPNGDCTTYLATQIVKFLLTEIPETKFLDYPNLIRLMPNIPYKTRGNAAVAIRVRVSPKYKAKIISEVHSRIRAIKITDEGTNPAAVFLEGKIPQEILNFGEKALFSFIPIKEAKMLIAQF